ncbi:unnamed protein product [Symbiodinium sp. CCMP2592]|nr:unnamed protein product [Symbiodinium sp. CCMP2592]
MADTQTIASRTSYLTNAVEALFGHAGSREMASKCVNETLKSGWKLVTHDSSGHLASNKPYRFMVLRYFQWAELVSMGIFEQQVTPSTLAEMQGAAGIWHVVIRDFRYKPEGPPNVVSTYFSTHLDLVYAAVQEKFDLLQEEDDPRLIEAALQEEDFRQLLEDYFMTGDTSNARFYKTLATLSCLGSLTLLHFCCEHGLCKCVEFLLHGYCSQTAEHPWLQLADPLWQERTWGNNAFSIAAYRGDEKLLQILWAWAEEHDRVGRVAQSRTKSGQSLIDIIEERLQKRGSKGNPRAAFNVIAPAFNRSMLDAGIHIQSSTPELPKLVIDASLERDSRSAATPSSRQMIPLQACEGSELSLASLAQTLEECSGRLAGKSLLILNASFRRGTEDDMNRLMKAVSSCHRVAVKGCSSRAETCIGLGRAVVKRLQEDPPPAWRSIDLLPQWNEAPSRSSPVLTEFADTLEALLHAGLNSRNLDFQFELPARAGRYLPEDRYALKGLAKLAFTPKRLAYSLLENQSRNKQLESNLLANFKAFNPLLCAPAYLERVLLPKEILLKVSAVEPALNASWVDFVERIVQIWVGQAAALPEWAMTLQFPSARKQRVLGQIVQMVDGAVLHFAKMRPRKTRPGLSAMIPALHRALEECPGWPNMLPKTANYLQSVGCSAANAQHPVPRTSMAEDSIPQVSSEIGRQSASDEHAAVATPTAPAGSEPLEPPPQVPAGARPDAFETSAPSSDWVLLTFKGSTNVIRSTLLRDPTEEQDLLMLRQAVQEAEAVEDLSWTRGAVLLLPVTEIEIAKKILDQSDGPLHRRNQVLTQIAFEGLVVRVLTQLPCRKRPKLADRSRTTASCGASCDEAPEREFATSANCTSLPELPPVELQERLVVKRTFLDIQGDTASENSLVTQTTGALLLINPRRKLGREIY